MLQDGDKVVAESEEIINYIDKRCPGGEVVDWSSGTEKMIIEQPHDKTNKMACAPIEDSDQPGRPPSLIRVFAVHMKKAWVLSYPLSAQRRL